jgi:uncharacterized protein (DUF1778 family)
MRTPDRDQTVFTLPASDFDEFLELLERPVEPTPRLDALMARPTVFER